MKQCIFSPSKIRRGSLVLLCCCLLFMPSARAQTDTTSDSKGIDFWLTFPGNYDITATPSLFITGEANTTGTVTIPGTGFSASFTVTVGAVTSVVLPVSVFINASSTIQSNGIHVKAAKEVTIYGLNRLTASTDAYLALPTNILGTDYINLGYANVDIVNATQFGLVATQNSTVVTITPTVATDTHAAGVSYNITLNQGQTYLLRNESAYPSDLSGSIITSDKPVAVFGGHQCANIPRGYVACDHIVEELPPTPAWGRNFVTVPLKTRLRGDTFRFLAAANGTAVTVNGTNVATLNRGQFYETILATSAQITATHPILVSQYSNSSSYDGVTSDPFMMLIPPTEQFLGNYTITTPATGFGQNFVNVVAPKAAVGVIKLDGIVIPAAQFTAIGPSGYYGAQINIGLGAHTLNGANQAFGVFVYGFDAYDSYGYPGGESLAPVATVTGISVTPKTGNGSVGVSSCFNALVRDQFNNTVGNIKVDFIIKGANASRSGFSTTNANGIAQFCYAGVNAGPDSILASLGQLTDVAFFTWDSACNLSSTAKVDAYGVVTIAASGGMLPYTYTVNGTSNTTGVFAGLRAGSYNYTVNDAKNCTGSGSITIVPGGSVTETCFRDTTFIANPVTCNAKVKWPAPSAMFPDTIAVMKGINLSAATLLYKGTFNGHGYYESNDQYNWPNAIAASRSVGSHLISITSEAENNFVNTHFDERYNYAWIGLRSTGIVGSFAWVTGEPLNYSNWIPGEPNNLWHDPSFVHEPFGHINGFDSLSRWNDISGDVNMKLIAEYDSAVIAYRQITGPTNGDSLKPGVYTICYERTNAITKVSDTCCFNITVLCNSITSGCLRDTTFIADPVTCRAKVTWAVPPAMFPDTVLLGGPGALLIYKGTLNGHGYYESNFKATWPDARLAVSLISGHLVSITSAAENNFVHANFNEEYDYAWIGLYNTGTVGSFAWVTGEPLGYSDWIPGQPDNLWRDPSFVHEPYVHINGYDSLSRWNDIGPGIEARFLAEFDSSIIRYRQVSGPADGDSLKAGTYTVCFEIMKTTDVFSPQRKDTCCFNITVLCNSMVTLSSDIRAGSAPMGEAGSHTFNAVAYPNPSTTGFSVKLHTGNLTERVSMKVVDVAGRTIETKSIAPGNTLIFGSSYVPGIYFTTITQGSKSIIMKLVKQ